MKMKDENDMSISPGRLKIANKLTQAKKKRGGSLTYRFQKEEDLMTPWFQTSSLQNHETIYLFFLSHLFCSALLQQP